MLWFINKLPFYCLCNHVMHDNLYEVVVEIKVAKINKVNYPQRVVSLLVHSMADTLMVVV